MAKCEKCGSSTTFAFMRWFIPDDNGRNHEVCKRCMDAAKASGKELKYDMTTGRVIEVSEMDLETRKKCNVCGYVYCYTPGDIRKNMEAKSQAKWSTVAGVGGILSGDYTSAAVNSGNADASLNRIVDYNRCPRCGSMNVTTLTKEQFLQETSRRNGNQSSPADELKKYKELLDMGAISLDEYNAKKKQLLG